MEIAKQFIQAESLWGRRDLVVKKCYELEKKLLAESLIGKTCLVTPVLRNKGIGFMSNDLKVVSHEYIHDIRDVAATPPAPYIINNIKIVKDCGKMESGRRVLTFNELISWCRIYHDMTDEVFLSSSKIFYNFAGIRFFNKRPAIIDFKKLQDGIVLSCDMKIIV